MAGALLVLFVYFPGLVDSDVRPLLASSGGAAASPEQATQILPGAPAEDLD